MVYIILFSLCFDPLPSLMATTWSISFLLYVFLRKFSSISVCNCNIYASTGYRYLMLHGHIKPTLFLPEFSPFLCCCISLKIWLVPRIINSILTSLKLTGFIHFSYSHWQNYGPSSHHFLSQLSHFLFLWFNTFQFLIYFTKMKIDQLTLSCTWYCHLTVSKLLKERKRQRQRENSLFIL